MVDKDNFSNKELDETAFIIFGVTGDLTSRKLIPAIYELYRGGRIPKIINLVGFARRDWSDEKLKSVFEDSIRKYSQSEVEEDQIKGLMSNVKYIQSSFDQQVGYEQLSDYLKENKIKNILFYLATPPDAYDTIIKKIGRHKLDHSEFGWTRIVIEKPYGRDLQTAIDLEKLVHTVFKENQIYRIDHYLGKETVQNILVLRFANGIFEPIWN